MAEFEAFARAFPALHGLENRPVLKVCVCENRFVFKVCVCENRPVLRSRVRRSGVI